MRTEAVGTGAAAEELGTAGEAWRTGGSATVARGGGSPEGDGRRAEVGGGTSGVTRPMAGVGVPRGARVAGGADACTGASKRGLGAAAGGGVTTGALWTTPLAEEDAAGVVGKGLLASGGHTAGSPGVRGAAGGSGLPVEEAAAGTVGFAVSVGGRP